MALYESIASGREVSLPLQVEPPRYEQGELLKFATEAYWRGEKSAEELAALTAAALELEREMEYFVEPEEAFTRDEIE